MTLQVRVLGPLSVRHGEVEVAPTAQQPRTVLALLLLHAGRVVPAAALVDELWAVPPAGARATLQFYVFHLRERLARAGDLVPAEVAGSVLQTADNGYRFAVPPGRSDLHAFRRLRRAGVAALAAGDLRSGAHHFRRALDLWRGPAVAGVRPGTRIRAEVAALEQSRATLLDYRIELDLRLGRHRETLGELAALTARDRFHETAHAQYALALHRSGHRARALEVLHRLRLDLRAEFGLEPSPPLRELHRGVLTADPGLDRAGVVPLPRRSAPVPELPAAATSF